MKSKGYSDIKVRVPRVSIWCCGKVIHSLRLAGSLYPILSMLPSSQRNTCTRSPRVEDYGVERNRRSDMRLESLWSYHGPLSVVGMGWREEGVFVVGGNRVWRAELAEYKSTWGSYTNQPAAIEPYVGSGIP